VARRVAAGDRLDLGAQAERLLGLAPAAAAHASPDDGA
jgi:hypothetical protein